MKILYAAPLSPHDSARDRMHALERLGHTLIPLDSTQFLPSHSLLRKATHRLQLGSSVTRLNAAILRVAAAETPDLFWADKLLSLQPGTLRHMRTAGIASVSYMIDNAFGPRRDPGWRLYRQCLPLVDLHVTQRDSNVTDYLAHGARDVLKIQTAYEPTRHFPPRFPFTDADRTRDVSFIGTPYDDRAYILTRLWRNDRLPVTISGGLWPRVLDAAALAALYTGTELFGVDYREAIWRSKINLSFLTHSNRDEFAHKSFEIAACGGFLLAERSKGHAERFLEDEEAVFFTGYDELAAKIRRYLPDEAGRTRVARAGRERAVRSGYSNDAQMARVIERVRQIPAFPARPPHGLV